MATITKKDLLEALDIEHTQCGDLSGTPYYEEKSAKIKTTYKVVKALIRFAQNENEISGSSFAIWENTTTPCERLKVLLEYNVKHLGTEILNTIETDVKRWVNGVALSYEAKYKTKKELLNSKKTIKQVDEILDILDPLTPNDPKAKYKYYDTDGYPIAATIKNTLYCFKGVKEKSIPDLDTRIRIACGKEETKPYDDLKTTLEQLKSDVDKEKIMNQIRGAVDSFVDCDIKGGQNQNNGAFDTRTGEVAENNSGESYAKAFKQAAKNYSARSQQGTRGLFVVGNNRGNFSHNRIGLDEEAVSQMFKDFARTIPTTSEIAKEVTEVIKKSFEKELTDICVTNQKIKEIEEKFNEFINNIPDFMEGIEEKIGDSFDNIIKALEDGKKIQEQLAAGQEAQGKNLKELLEKQEEQDKINRRLDLYMTSTEKTIAENTAQLKNVEKMLQLKEEKDRENFDAIKKGIEGLAEGSQVIKDKIGGLLKEETAFQEFQTLRDQNKEIKEILNGMCEYLKNQDTVLQDKISTASEKQITEIKEAIAASDAKLLGMIMPEIANLKDKNNQILINQDTQTTILNSILSGQRDDALQYVAMSEKLDNLTELVSALGTKTNEQSFAENANTLLENFAKSQEAAFATVAKKEDLKRIDTGIDSIINMLSDNSITLKMMNEAIMSMVSQINVMSIDIKRVLEILSQTRIELGTVADCDRCHSAKSMFYKCQVCGYDGREIDPTTEEQAFPLYQSGKKLLIAITDTDMCNKQTDNKQTDDEQAGNEQTGNYIFYISHLSQHQFADNETVDASKVEKIVFDICDKCEGDCNQCDKTMTIKLISRTNTGDNKKSNIWGYFTNLKAISFAKTKDGKAKYILGTGLLCEEKLKKIYETTFYGGRYLGTPEQGICNISDNKIALDILRKIDPMGIFHTRVSGDTWRTPKNNE